MSSEQTSLIGRIEKEICAEYGMDEADVRLKVAENAGRLEMVNIQYRATSYAPVCRTCGKLSPLGGGNNYSTKEAAMDRADTHENNNDHTVDILEEGGFYG